MGVYIKGMEMPKNCRACRLKMNCDDCEGFECVCLPLHTQIGYLNDLLTDKRRDDCPLVLVPPHGRLIEKNAVFELIQSVPSVDKLLPVEFMKALYKIPTVIEAEEEICTKN